MRGAAEGIDITLRKPLRPVEWFKVDGFIIPSDMIRSDWQLDSETGFLTVTFMPRKSITVEYKE